MLMVHPKPFLAMENRFTSSWISWKDVATIAASSAKCKSRTTLDLKIFLDWNLWWLRPPLVQNCIFTPLFKSPKAYFGITKKNSAKRTGDMTQTCFVSLVTLKKSENSPTDKNGSFDSLVNGNHDLKHFVSYTKLL